MISPVGENRTQVYAPAPPAQKINIGEEKVGPDVPYAYPFGAFNKKSFIRHFVVRGHRHRPFAGPKNPIPTCSRSKT